MPYTNMDITEWADAHGVDMHEIEQKLKLRALILKLRNREKLTQDALAERVGVSRSRIAQIENGVKIHSMSFDVFLRVIAGLGYTYNITTKREAA